MSPSQLSPNYYETPYIYSKVYAQSYISSAPITGPTGTFRDQIQSDGDSDFFARRAVNLYNFNDKARQQFISISPFGQQLQAIPIGNDMALVPEKLYPLGAGIEIFLATTNGIINPTVATLTYPGGTSAHVNIALPMFQGVKRFRGTPNDTPNYRYTEKPYTYPLPFTQNWTFLQSPYTTLVQASPMRFVVQVFNWDFELQALEFSGDNWNNNTGQNTYNGYLIKLYDANQYALMKDFVHYRQLSYNGGFIGNTKAAANEPGDTQPWYPNCFPVPPLIYPVGSQIIVDIVSLLDTSTTGGGASINQLIHFRGVNRVPC